MKRVSCLVALSLGAIMLPSAQTHAYCKTCLSAGNSFFCAQVSTGFLICDAYPSSCSVAVVCGGQPGCFLAGTLVNTRDGLTSIEELGVGDEVLSFDERRGEVVYARIVSTFKSVQYSYFVINGTIEVTAGHPFRTNGAWVSSEDIRVGDELWDERDELIRVQSIETVNRGVRVYNIEVEGTNTFFIDGVLVHNKTPDPGM
jgi:hypothetical protein